jgi:hypothetical protein
MQTGPDEMLNFLIVGAQKAATTFIHRCLAEHSAVFIPKDEIRAFEDPEYSNGEVDSLAELLKRAPPHALRGIKRPDYLALAECPARIHAFSPNAQLIVALRDPVQRAISAYYYYMMLGFLPVVTAEDGLQRILNGEYSSAYPKSGDILEYGRYATHLQRYLSFFDRRQILVTFDDDVKRDGLRQIQRVYEFLGIDASFVPQSIRRRHNTGVYSLDRIRFLRLRKGIVYDISEGRPKLVMRPGMFPRVFSATVAGCDRVFLRLFFADDRIGISRDTMAKLYNVFEPEITALERLLEIALGGWRKYGGVARK